MRCRFAPCFAVFALFALLFTAFVSSAFAAGALTGTSTAITTAQAFNLTTQGTGDWAHWGTTTATSFDHKTTGSTSISNYTLVGTGSVLRYTNNLTGYTWTDGTPTASATNSTTGIYISGTNNGFSFTVPAGTTSRTLTVYVGGYLSDGKLSAHLFDGSAADFTDSSYGYDKPGNINSKNYLPVYTLTYNAASAGQTLKITWTQTAGTGNVTLQSAALTPAAPAAPTNLVATPISPTQINLTWTAPVGTVTGYNIKRGTVSGGPYTTVGTSATASFSDTGLTAATHYYYVVTAVNGGSESVPSAEVLRTTLCTAPTNLTATATSTQIGVTWTASAGATSYSLYRGTSSGGEGATAYQTGLTGTSATDTSVTAGTTYYYTVKAINNGGTSAASNEASAVVSAAQSVSDLSTYATGSGKISLYWTAVAGATGYNLYRGTASGGENYASPINGTVPVNTASYSGSPMDIYTDTGLTNGTEYFYTVKAIYGTSQSQASNEDSDIPDPVDTPWDTRNPSVILSTIRSDFASDTNGIGADPFSLRAVGPDGTIYDDNFSIAQPPDGIIDAASNQIIRPDGSTQTLPNDEGELYIPPSTGASVTPDSIGPPLKTVSNGPIRRVKTFSNYRGADGYFALPNTNTNSPTAKANGDAATIYLGVTGQRLAVDAGLTYSDTTGWGLEMLITGHLHGIVAQPNPSSTKPIIPEVKLVNYPAANTRFSSGSTVRMTYWAWSNAPQTGHQKLSLLLVDDVDDGFAGALAGPASALGKQENVAAKRVHSIAQKNFGVVATGSTMDNGAWDYGQVALPDSQGSLQAWNSSITAEHGSYDGGKADVAAIEVSPYTAESNINIDINPPSK